MIKITGMEMKGSWSMCTYVIYDLHNVDKTTYQSRMLKKNHNCVEFFQSMFSHKSMFAGTLSTLICKHLLSSTGQENTIITQPGNFHKQSRQVAFTTGQNS